MDLITLHLKLAMKQPGCPLCRLRQESSDRYITGLLHESVNDVTTRTHLVRSLGLCSKHAWELQAIELDRYNNGLGTTIIYNDLTQRVLAACTRFATHRREHTTLPAATQREKLRHWLRMHGLVGQWLANLLPKSLPASSLLAELSPTESCRVCQIVNRGEETYLLWLVREIVQPEFQKLHTASDGLCLPHLRHALAIAESPAAVDVLVADTQHRLEVLHHNLDEYDRKQKWENHTEPVYLWEDTAWVRAIAFFSGEAPLDLSAHVQSARSQAIAGVKLPLP